MNPIVFNILTYLNVTVYNKLIDLLLVTLGFIFQFQENPKEKGQQSGVSQLLKLESLDHL